MSGPHPSDLPLLLVDDEESVLFSSATLLRSTGLRQVQTLSDSRALLSRLASQGAAVVVLDLFMPFLPGTELLPQIVRLYPEIPVIVMTAAQEVDTAVDCMRQGAFDYLVKPVEESRYVSAVRRALELRTLRRDLGELKRRLLLDELEHPDAFSAVVTVSRAMRALFQYVETVARSPEPVLITGETGVGKELLAETVHRLSRRNGRFVPLSAAGLDDNLFSDTLFGHLRGAFTGAVQAREGLVAQAAGGTLFLDEIGDLEIASQVKLLRLLQEQAYYPLGSDVQRRSDVRVVCATHRDLGQLMGAGAFREDLYYRLSVHQVRVPPLRERPEDIPLLVDHFLEQAAAALGKAPPRPPRELFDLLGTYGFPGNVRELRAMVSDAVAAHRGGAILALERFRGAMRSLPDTTGPGRIAENTSWLLSATRLPTLREAEEALIRVALERAGGNQGIAADLLGLSRTALNRRLAKIRGPD
jgi:two-component system, NtrC family, response regulator HydG